MTPKQPPKEDLTPLTPYWEFWSDQDGYSPFASDDDEHRWFDNQERARDMREATS